MVGRSLRVRGRRNVNPGYVPDYSPVDRPEVDPRVCGGDAVVEVESGGDVGRSPRVRGRQVSRSYAQVVKRSIPACAVETIRFVLPQCLRQVDPRVCGGDGLDASQWLRMAGRSPRVRGRLAQSIEIRL